MLKATVHKDMLEVLCPDSVPESLDRIKLFPFRVFSLVHFHEDVLSDGVGSTTENNHECSDEDSRMLISGERLFSIGFIGSFDPVPAAISVSTKSIRILES